MRSKLVGLGGWLKNSFIDYPGTVSTVLFFSSCNLRCPYCHNRVLVNCKTDESMRSDEVWEFLLARKGLIDGVVLSGGEPTLYPYLKDVIVEIKKIGYKVKLDTNGLLPDVVESFNPDYLALDIKTIPSRYGPLLKSSYDDIRERLKKSLSIVRRMGQEAEVRITVAPGIVDIDAVKELRSFLAGIQKVFLQAMDQSVELLDPSYETIEPVSAEEINQMRNILAESVGECVIR